jgi:hypothetical protein
VYCILPNVWDLTKIFLSEITQKWRISFHAQHIYNLLPGGKQSPLHPSRFTPMKEPQYPLFRRLDGGHSRSGHFEEEKNPLPQQGFKAPPVQPIA